MERVEQTQAGLEHLLSLHQQDFPRVKKPPYPEPRYMTAAEVDRERRGDLKAALRGVPFFRVEKRRQIRADVEAGLAAKIRAHDRRSDEQAAAARREIDAWWAALLKGEPQVVLQTVNEALSNNDRPSAAIQVEGDELVVVYLAPSISDVPDREVSKTPSGQLTTKVLSKTGRNELRSIAALGHMIATAREALAMAPSIQTVKVIGVADRGPEDFDVLLAGVFGRAAIDAVDWPASDAKAVLQAAVEAASVLHMGLSGRTKELEPLDLSDEPELRALADALSGAPRDD